MRIKRQDNNFRDNEKWCAHGQHWVLFEDFAKHARRKMGLSDYCKACMRDRYHANQYYDRDKRYRRLYDITIDQYNKLLEKQNHCCAICGATASGGRCQYLHVDHCHATQEIRGLLCEKCNRGLGMFNDSQVNLKAAIDYLDMPTPRGL